MALFRDGKCVDFLQSGRIEGRSAQEVAQDLAAMFEQHCGKR